MLIFSRAQWLWLYQRFARRWKARVLLHYSKLYSLQGKTLSLSNFCFFFFFKLTLSAWDTPTLVTQYFCGLCNLGKCSNPKKRCLQCSVAKFSQVNKLVLSCFVLFCFLFAYKCIQVLIFLFQQKNVIKRASPSHRQHHRGRTGTKVCRNPCKIWQVSCTCNNLTILVQPQS